MLDNDNARFCGFVFWLLVSGAAKTWKLSLDSNHLTPVVGSKEELNKSKMDWLRIWSKIFYSFILIQ